MKKNIGIACFLVVFSLVASVMIGCGQSSSSTTTTTLSSAASASDTAQSAVKATIGVGQASQSTGSMATTQPTTQGLSVKILSQVSPPAAFFTPLPADGWISIEACTFVSGETVHIRMYTKGGEQINAAFLASKKIATIEGYNWANMASSFDFTSFASKANTWLNYSTDWDPSSAAKIASFYGSSSKYRACSSLWDYIIFAYINPYMGNVLDYAYKMQNQTQTSLSAYPVICTPEAIANDGFGSQEARITGTHPDGSTINMTQGISVDAEGKPVSGTGSGTMTTPDGKTITINSMTVTFSNGAPSSGTMDLTLSSEKLHMVITMTGTGAATGKVYSTATSPETEVGTLVMFAAADANGYWGYFQDSATGAKEYF